MFCILKHRIGSHILRYVTLRLEIHSKECLCKININKKKKKRERGERVKEGSRLSLKYKMMMKASE